MSKVSDRIRAQGARDHASAAAEFFKQLSRQGSTSFNDREIEWLHHLTPDQRQKLFKRVIASPLKTPSPMRPTPHLTRWIGLPPPIRRQLVAITMMSTALVTWPILQQGYEIYANTRPISINTDYWPSCLELDVDTDNCVYRVQKSLSWRQASNFLRLPIETIAQNNRHLPCCTAPLNADDRMIVWRGIRQTTEDNHE